MLCTGCGKKIPFVGDVCPYCQRDKSNDQRYTVLAVVIGIPLGWIGYMMFGIWGAILGLICGCFIALSKSGISKSTPPEVAINNNKQEQTDRTWFPDRTIIFSYTNANGEVSKNRVVDLERVYRQSGNIYIEGYCRKKDDQRTFRLDRIDGGIYIPAADKLLSIEEWGLRQDIEEDSGGDRFENVMKAHNKPVTAPSGFVFPFFPYNTKTIVRIYDSTNYYELMLKDMDTNFKRNFSQKDFDHIFDPTQLEIEVDSFETMFSPSTLKKINIKPIPGLMDLYSELNDKIENNEPLEWRVNQYQDQILIDEGLLKVYEIEKTDQSVSKYLEQLKVADLKELCKKFNEKCSQNKKGLINSLLEHKENISIDRMAKPTKKLSDLINNLTNIYIKDIKEQLKDFPPGYVAAVWECVADDYFLMEKVRNYARSQILMAETQLSH